ncbi:Sugar phosphate isomerase/epimerase [Fontibacillus panacisegetis]|uniref:Sugar phosphate isomerase/epimerase n=1 Tax=Fontibacillus panacisegetis TaxID=670482 RepID=A0A1G7I9A1_9BACL|nr:sugar phosphate isomerase/epimerase [Fontibacillus panacisegetis]SDF09275.1 Sugar phosphate isomerase/epimerase [Fontibacillus panacisegetis]
MAQVGLQLYTVRDQLDKDFEGTLRKIAELGYQGVEFANFYDRTAEEVKAILDETGLSVVGAHRPYTQLRDALEEEIAFNKAIGNRYIVLPYLIEEDRNKWDEVIADLRKIGKRCAEEDMVLCYHNHEFELEIQYGDQPVLDAIYAQVPAELLQVELDSCWVSYAGLDPVKYITKYSGRLPLLHLKDMITKEDGSAETVELGKGEIAVEAIANAAIDNKVAWLIVEQDYCAGNSMDSIAVSMEWIKQYANNGGKIHV